MAAEPAAVHAGKPVAFFVGKATDTSDSFVKAIVQSGFGSGDSATETVVLQQFAQVCMHACVLTALRYIAHTAQPMSAYHLW